MNRRDFIKKIALLLPASSPILSMVLNSPKRDPFVGLTSTEIPQRGASVVSYMSKYQRDINEALDIAARKLAEQIDRDIMRDIYLSSGVVPPESFNIQS